MADIGRTRARRSEEDGEAGPRATRSSIRAPMAFLVATSLICGALVMVIEVLGSRVIGPYFGVSLFVWTALITVTLVGLAAGYAVGGWLSDRHPSADWLYGLILVAGLLVLAIPHVKDPVLRASMSLGIRAGALVSATAIFFPSLFLLGCVSPYIVKIAAQEIRSIGWTVGVLAAVSTVGSFLGTVLTGFVLITAFGVARVFTVTGVLLLAVAGCYFALIRRRGWLVAPAVLALLLPQRVTLRSGETSNGSLVREIYKADSFYGHVDVLDVRSNTTAFRALIVDGAFQGGMDLATGLSAFPYPYFLQFLPYGLNPQGKRCLVVGLGAGVVPAWYERMGIVTDVVEIDPEVLDIARRHFGLALSGRTIVDDARHFLNVNQDKYDFVVLDAFSGDTFPGHLLTREALSLVAAAMAPGSVLALNLVAGLAPGDQIAASVVRTLASVFDQVEVRPLYDPRTARFGNIEIVAYQGPPRTLSNAALADLPVVPDARWAMSFLWNTRRLAADAGTILTDDYNPMEVMDLDVKEDLRRSLAANRAGWDLSGSR
jgi:spermidine synthase